MSYDARNVDAEHALYKVMSSDGPDVATSLGGPLHGDHSWVGVTVWPVNATFVATKSVNEGKLAPGIRNGP